MATDSKSETNKYLDQLKDKIISEARGNLSRKRKNAFGKLSKSLRGTIKESKRSFEITFKMNAYGFFQDRGVQGKERGTSYSNFKYRDKAPPASAFLPWIKKRGLKPRNKKTGKFMSHKSLAFAIAQSVYKKGIKPTLFFTKPFEKYSRKIPKELIERYEIDLLRLFDRIETEELKK